MKLALCIAGCGLHARTLSEAIATVNERVELFFASRDRDRARDYCQTYGGRDYFGSYEEAARDPRVDAMYFLTPAGLNGEYALLAARHHKHILMVKPIATNLEEGRKMITAAKDASVKLMVAENFFFKPLVRKCKELIDQGAIGPVRLIQVQGEMHSQGHPDNWRADLKLSGGGAFLEGGTHLVNIMICMAGMPTSVYATNLAQVLHHLEVEDGLIMLARMANGATGLVNFSWGNVSSAEGRGSRWLAVSGAKGRIDFKIDGTQLYLDTGDERKEFQYPDDIQGNAGMVVEFADAIQEDRPPLFSNEDAMNDLKVVLGAYESAKTGAPVSFG